LRSAKGFNTIVFGMAFSSCFRKHLPGWLCMAVLLFPRILVGAQTTSYDGDWWQKSTAAEQEGFILGYGDCYADPEGSRVRGATDEVEVRFAVSTYYQGHASERHRPASKVLKDVWSGHIEPRNSQPPRAGEGWHERHGFLDGGWWTGSNHAEQLGFIEGYVTCHNTEEVKQALLRQSPAWYAAQVSSWYDEQGDEETVAQRRATKIHEVLPRLEPPSASGTR
jgi:hypothetical protein